MEHNCLTVNLFQDLLYLLWDENQGGGKEEEAELKEFITNLSNSAIWWTYFSWGREVGGGSKLATEYRRQLVQMFQTFNTDLKQNGASNINASSTHLLSSFFSWLYCWMFISHLPPRKPQTWNWIHICAWLKCDLIKKNQFYQFLRKSVPFNNGMQCMWLFFKSQGMKQTQPSTHMILALQHPEGPPDIYTTTSILQIHSLLSISPKIWIQWGKKSDLKANTQVNVIKYQKVKSTEVLCLGINVLWR